MCSLNNQSPSYSSSVVKMLKGKLTAVFVYTGMVWICTNAMFAPWAHQESSTWSALSAHACGCCGLALQFSAWGALPWVWSLNGNTKMFWMPWVQKAGGNYVNAFLFLYDSYKHILQSKTVLNEWKWSGFLLQFNQNGKLKGPWKYCIMATLPSQESPE